MTIKGIAILCLGLVILALAAANAPDLFSGMSAGGGVVIVPPPTQAVSVPSINITGTVNVNCVSGCAGAGTPQFTQPVSVPTIGVVVWPSIVAPVGTVWIGNGTASPVPVAISAVPTVYVTGVPAPLGTVWIGNSTGSPVPIATLPGIVATVQVNSRELNTIGVIQQGTPAATQPVSVPTIGVQMFNTPAVQGSVSINNTPDVILNDRLSAATTMATSGAPGNVVDTFVFGTSQVLIEISGTYTGTISFQGQINTSALLWAINAYPLTNGEISGPAVTSVACAGTCTNRFVIRTGGLRDIRLNMTAYTSGTATVWVQAGPGAVSNFVLNTPGVAIQNTAAIQIWPTPLPVAVSATVQAAAIIQNTPMVQQPTANPCLNPLILPTTLPINIVSSATAIVATPAAGNRLIICDLNYSNPAANPVQWVAASATASAVCPSPTAVTGSVVGNFNVNGEPALTLGTGQKLCAWPQGTAISVQGVVSYVQQP